MIETSCANPCIMTHFRCDYDPLILCKQHMFLTDAQRKDKVKSLSNTKQALFLSVSESNRKLLIITNINYLENLYLEWY